MKSVRVLVSGRVQGVGYRYATRDEARRLGLTGWVRNLPTGEVEVFAQGPGPIVDQLLAWLEDGPRLASVSSVEIAAVSSDDNLTTFSIQGYPQGF
jgi:acylphosphatase